MPNDSKNVGSTEYLSDIYDSPYDDWENFLVYNTGKNVSPNFNFMLRVEGLFDLPCRRVHAFTKANEYEYIQEGGLNDYVHMRRKPISQPFTFQVERYVGVDYLDPLQPGTDLILPIVLFVCRMQMKGNFMPFRTYTFTGCTVMSKEYGELNAEQSGLHTEITTIGYRELIRVTLPDGILEGIANAAHRFDFEVGTDDNGNKYLKTKGKHSSARKPPNDSDRETPTLWAGYDDKNVLIKEGTEITKTKADGTTYTVINGSRAAKPVEAPVKQTPHYWTGNTTLEDGADATVKLDDGTSYSVKHYKSANQKGNKASTAKTPRYWTGKDDLADGTEAVVTLKDGKSTYNVKHYRSADQMGNKAGKKKTPRYWAGNEGDLTDGSAATIKTEDGKSYSVTHQKSSNQKNVNAATVKKPSDAKPIEWTGIRPNKVNTVNIRANFTPESLKKAKERAISGKVLWSGLKKNAPVSTRNIRANFTPDSRKKAKEKAMDEQVLWEGIKENQPPSTENKRANFTQKSLEKAKERADSEKVIWEGIMENQPPSTENKRANFTPKSLLKAKEKAMDEQVLWEGIKKNQPPSTVNKRANFTPDSLAKALERADSEKALWEGLAENKPPSTKNLRARVPQNDSARASKVLWSGGDSKPLRAKMADILK